MKTLRILALAAAVAAFAPASGAAQDASLDAARRVASLRAEPAEVTVEQGATTAFSVVAVDASGNVVEGAEIGRAHV